TPLRVSGHCNPRRYSCERGWARGESDDICLRVASHVLEGPLAEFVLAQLGLGGLAGDVVGELEREQAEAEVQKREREQATRRLQREIAFLESNLETALQSEVLTPERLARMDRQIVGKRAELAML